MSDHERLQRLLGGEPLADLRRRLRARYEQGAESDSFTLTRLSTVARQALESLLGRRAKTADSMRVTQSELDAVLLRAGLAADLRTALTTLDGPILERRALRLASDDAWRAVFDEQEDPRIRAVVGDTAGRGLVKRLTGGDPIEARRLLEEAQRVLRRLPEHGLPLSRLAAEALGDAHGLDAGSAVATLVLRAFEVLPASKQPIAPADEAYEPQERQEPQEPEVRTRNRWAKAGVSVNELAAPVLCLNLRAKTDTPIGRTLEQALQLGEPIHLSLRSLLRTPLSTAAPRMAVFVCENPSVVAVAADALGKDCAPLVCTDGMPAAAQRTLLVQLAASGAQLHYHGDFDWPGIRIGNFVMRQFGAKPWRFGAQDYTTSVRKVGRRLEGLPAIASWDIALPPAMKLAGMALEEEVVVEQLLNDLA